MLIRLNKPVFFLGKSLFEEQKFTTIGEVLDTELKYKDEELLAAWLILIYKYNNEYEWPEGVEIDSSTKISDLFGCKEKLQNIQVEKKLYLQLCVDEQPSDFGVFTFVVIREEQKLKLELQYNALIDEEIARNILNHYGRIIKQFDAKKTVREIILLNKDEYNKIVYDWNRTEASYPKDKTIHQLFEEQVERTPDNVAVVFEDKQLTYRELNERANQLASCIRYEYKEHWGEEVKGDTFIGIYIERSLEMIIGILGILKAGGAYVPFDSEDPEERLKFKIADSGCKLVITSSKSIDHLLFLAETDTLPFSIDGYWEEISKFPKENPVHINKSTDLAYVIYTSGSTGWPKGVMVEHKNVINLLYSLKGVYDYEEGKVRSTAFTSYVFDVSVSELMMPLINGAELHIFSDDLKRSPLELADYVSKKNINYLYLPPALLSVFPKEKYTELKTIIYAGEPCDRSTGIYWAGEKKLFNLYGPTETTIYSIGKQILNGEVEQIGKPINNTTCYILDTSLQAVPIGVKGELYISGDGLTRGYLNRPELTAERFIPNPFASEKDKAKGKNLRIYKTGDLCRWLPDGNIEYIGRNDLQVKIRGFRIELGEIESVMAKYEGVAQAVVVAREKEGNRYLVGYYTEKAIDGRQQTIDKEKLREYLLKKLPDYMIPTQLIYLENIPLNTSGKIDRKKLPKVEFSGDENKYIAPRTEMEKALCAIWSEVLKIIETKIGIHDDFFSLGGNSLKLIMLTSRFHRELKKTVKVKELFANTTIEKQADMLATKTSDIDSEIKHVEEKEYYPAIASQARMYLVNKLEGNDTAYNVTQLFRLQGKLDKKRLKESIDKIVEKHEAFRTSFGMKDNEVIQRIADKVEYEFIEKAIEEREIEKEISSLVRPFDLEKAPLFRIGLFKIKLEEHILALDVHHSIFDGQSLNCFVEDFIKAYQGEELGKLTVRNRDYAEWEKERRNTKDYQGQKEYWQKELSGEIELVKLPADKPRGKMLSHNGRTIRKEVGKELCAKVKDLARKQGITTFNIFFAAYGIVLSKYSNQEDVIVGIPSIGRAHNDIEENIGMFVSSLPIRMNVKNKLMVKDYLKEISRKVKEGVNNQEYPLEEMLAEKRHDYKEIDSLFSVMFAIEEAFGKGVNVGDLKISEYLCENKTAKFELLGYVYEKEESAEITYEYMTELFEEGTIERIADSYEKVLKQITENIELTLGEITLLNKDEYNKIVFDWNRTEAPYPKDKTIHQLFEEQVERTPNNIAVVFEDKHLTYRQLDSLTNYIACEVNKTDIQIDEIVSIIINRNENICVGGLAVNKAGGAFVFIDPALPEDRKEFLLKDYKIKTVLCDEKYASDLKQKHEVGKVLIFEDLITEWKSDHLNRGARSTERKNNANDLFAIITTSGTTGLPKGSMIEHRNFANFAACYNKLMGTKVGEQVASYASFSFDVSAATNFAPLLCGATVHILPEEIRMDVIKLNEYFISNNISSTFFPTPIGELYIKEIKNSSLKVMAIGGEQLSGYWRRSYRIVNAYAPSECTVAVLMGDIEEKYRDRIPLGRVQANNKIYIFDKNMQICPVGVAGELYIGGAQVGRGYYNREKLNREKFIEHEKFGRLYRSGDLAKWTGDGQVVYLERVDEQVKLRGLRIELGEIEAQMQKIPGISQTLVVVRENSCGNKYLIGYYTWDKNIKIYKTKEEQEETVEAWEHLYDNNYVNIEQVVFGEVFQGWKSSYTGEDIPLKEMREWRDDTIEQVMHLNPKRVIEVGCGSGLLLVKLAPDVIEYAGIDFSKPAIKLIEEQIRGTELEGKVKLYVAAADKITQIVSGKYDCIVINSVVQYFPDIEYLSDVIKQCFERLEEGGKLYIGDIRSYDLFDEYHKSVEFFKSEEAESLEQILKTVNYQKQIENELLISPKYFFRLKTAIPELTDIEILAKKGKAVNELTKYRYAAVLYKGQHKEKEAKGVEFVWSERRKNDIESAIKENSNETIIISGIPNEKLKADFELINLLKMNKAVAKAEILKQQSHDDGKGILVRLCELGSDSGYKSKIYWSDHRDINGYALLLYKGHTCIYPSNQDITGHEVVANVPNVAGEMSKRIMEYLLKKLPDYMIPIQLICLENMPLNTSGKIDRKRLPEVEITGNEGKYVAPRTELEKKLCAIWSEMLGIDESKIGVHDNFFSLGGNSLKVIMLVFRINKELKITVRVKELFTYTTIEKQADMLATKASDIDEIKHVEEKEYYPAVAAQARMYLVNKLEGNDTTYNITLLFSLQGRLDKKRLKESIDKIVEKHEAFRTSFGMKDNEVIQRIADKVEYEFIEKAVEEKKIEKELSSFVRPFDLEKAPLFRIGLFRIKLEEHILVLDVHHSIFDGQSIDCFVEDLVKVYQGEELGKLTVRNRDYAEWEKKRRNSKDYQRQKEYWQKELSGEIELVKLPVDKPWGKTLSHNGRTIRKEVGKELYAKVKDLARKQGITTFNIFFAAYGIVLSKYSNQKDVIVGIPSIGRAHNDIEENIGMFVSSLPIRMNIENELTVKDYLLAVNTKIKEGISNQEYHLEEMLAEKRQEYNETNSLFNVMFATVEDLGKEVKAGDLKISGYTTETQMALFELIGYVCEKEESSEITYEYMTELFEEGTIERIADSYEKVLKQITENIELTLGEITLLNKDEYNKIVYDWNRTEASYPKDKTIHQLFEEQAERTPDNVAVIFKDKQLTYRELNERANQLAHCIRHEYKEHWGEEVKGDTLIGIYLERSLEMIIGILGILKAGGAYVPFDSADPEERLKFKIADSGCKLVITSSKSIDHLLFLAETDTLPFSIDGYWEEISKFPKENPAYINKSTDLAYVIYTSGSSGQPKGVMVEHFNISRLVLKQNYTAFEGCTIAQASNISFDAATFEIWGALLNGQKLVILTKDDLLGDNLGCLLNNYAIDTMWLTSGLFNELISKNCSIFSGIKNLLVGGDIVSKGHSQKLLRTYNNIRLINGYGPTESTTFTTTYNINNVKEWDLINSIPIGKPINNTTCYILDDTMQPVPIGVSGELYIGGDGLARGYLDRPELTTERFISNPFASEEDKAKGRNLRLYKTGDLCRWLPDGNIEYIGRNDLQVKIRGFRIELGEIENVMAGYEGVAQVAVVAREKEGNKYLIGYYTEKTIDGRQETVNKDKLREYLSSKLPDYMIPAQLICLENMPLNTSGKIDRKKLSNLDISLATSQEYIPPVSEEEKMISKIWSRVLNLEKISIKETFFSIGGNSLNAIKLASEISKTFLRNIPVITIFQKKTIEEQSKEAARLIATPSEDIVFLKNGENYKETLILFPPGYSGAEAYYELAGKLNPDIRVIGLNNYLINNPNSDFTDTENILKRYLALLESKGIFKDGKPVSLGGWSLGGNISLSALRLLKEINVKTVFLFDAVLGEENEPKQVKELNTENPDDPDNSFFARFKDAGYSREQIVAMIERVSAGMSSLKYERIKEAASHIKIILFKARQEAMGVNIKDEFNGWEKYYENIEKIDIQSANHFNVLSEPCSVDIISNTINKCFAG